MLVTLFGMVMEVRLLQPSKAPELVIAKIESSIIFVVLQRITPIEGMASDAGHAVRDGDGGQAAAFIEDTAADAGHTVWNDDGGQAAAISEGIVADAGHAVWDGDGGQAAAVFEGIIADACHAVSFTTVCHRWRNDDRT